MDSIESSPLKKMKAKLRKSFRRKKEVQKENERSSESGFEHQTKEYVKSKKHISLTPLQISRSSSLETLRKRKDAHSPGLPKKRPFRKIALPFLSPANHSNIINHPEPAPETPSAFESEFADHEYQSLNDPEFIRKTSFRWKRKNGMSKAENLNLFIQNRHSDPVTFQWPTYPCQQPTCQKIVSCMPEAHECAMQHACMSMVPFPKECLSSSDSHQSVIMPTLKENKSFHDDKTKAESNGLLKRTASFRLSFRRQPSIKHTKKAVKGKSLDDSVTEAVKREAQREEMRKVDHSVTSILGQLHLSRNRSFRNSKRTFSFGSAKNSSSSLATSPSCPKKLSGVSNKPKLTSASCHSGLSTWGHNYSASQLNHQVTFEDIFVAEPAIAEKFAIMFPSEPRPEWHRHLRQVLHKAGQKIFKKPEHHDTTIPEDLRYQLKQIYVY